MTANIGTLDRIFRFALGIILLAAPFVIPADIFGSLAVTSLAVIAGVVMLATSATRFCPMYRIFGFRTCKT